MVAGLLLVLVILNAFLTGALLVRVVSLSRDVRHIGTVLAKGEGDGE